MIIFCGSKFSVGHDDTEMILEGSFTYGDVNQRALPFHVNINEMDGSSGIFQGRNSK